jgi:hypothetical protein
MYLYVKTHNKTGLKYLGKTVNEDPYNYPGSGTRWRNHLEKHGYDYTTEILLETDSEEELKEKGIYYSNLWNIVESKEWANLMIEQGDGGDVSASPAFREYLKNREPLVGGKNPFFGKTHTEETKKKLSKLASKQWKGVPKSEEHKRKITEANTGQIFTKERKEKISLAMKGKVPYNKGKPAEKFVCKYCGKEVGGASNFKRWHGDNCKDRS